MIKIKTFLFTYFSKESGRAGLWSTRANKMSLACEKFYAAMSTMGYKNVCFVASVRE